MGDDGQLMSSVPGRPPILRLSTHAAHLTAPMGDDGQLISGRLRWPPVLRLSANAVQLTAPIGDDGQLMSGCPRWPASPIAEYTCSSIFSSYAAGSFSFFLCIPLINSANFSVPLPFLFSALQTFSFLFRSSFLLFRLFRSYFVPLFRSSFRSSIVRRWGFPKHR